MTSSQYYHGLNRRFDRRARQLRKAGFRYQILDVDGPDYCRPDTIGAFTRCRYGRVRSIAAATVMLAPALVWLDTLSRTLTH